MRFFGQDKQRTGVIKIVETKILQGLAGWWPIAQPLHDGIVSKLDPEMCALILGIRMMIHADIEAIGFTSKFINEILV